MKQTEVTVLGAGSWGIALANYFKWAGHDVTLWGRDQSILREVGESGSSERFFPGVPGRPGILTEENLDRAIGGAELVVFAVPSIAVREVAQKITQRIVVRRGLYVVSAVKGIEAGSNFRISEILSEYFPQCKVSVLSGPSFAVDLLQNRPVALTFAANVPAVAVATREFLHSELLRVYIHDDVVGVELGGTIKNVLAVAAGVVDGAQMGVSARSALLTRGLAEMRRLIVAAGGRNETAMGLSGVGDLMLTATSDLSRNRRVGLALGRGGVLEKVLLELGQVSEGVSSAKQVYELAQKFGVQMPISTEVLNLLLGKHSVGESVRALLSRAPGVE